MYAENRATLMKSWAPPGTLLWLRAWIEYVSSPHDVVNDGPFYLMPDVNAVSSNQYLFTTEPLNPIELDRYLNINRSSYLSQNHFEISHYSRRSIIRFKWTAPFSSESNCRRFSSSSLGLFLFIRISSLSMSSSL